MKNVLTNLRTAALICCFFCAAFAVNAQIVNIPDANFKNALVNTLCVDTDNNNVGDADVDTNNDGEIQVSEALAVIALDVFSNNISDLTGIESFANLQWLDCGGNQLQTVNVQSLASLRTLRCWRNQLSVLNLQNLTNLQDLYCGFNQISNLNLQGLTQLINLECSNSQLIGLNLQGLVNLQTLDCQNDNLGSLNLQNLINLRVLYCSNNHLQTLNVQGLSNLRNLYCRNNQLTSLNVQGLQNLQNLDCSSNHITYLDVYNTILNLFNCTNNPMVCLSFLPSTLVSLTTNVACIPNRPNGLQFGTFPSICQANNINGCFFQAQISGKVFKANNCTPTNTTLPNTLVQVRNIANVDTYIANSDTAGVYAISVPPGTYIVSVITSNSYWQACTNTATITITQSGQQLTRNVLVNALVPCTDMEIDHAAQTIMRPCSTATMVVNYYNKGTITSQGSYAELTLAPELTLSAASVAYTAQGNNVYRFAIGTVNALQRGSFTLNVAVACTAVLGQTLCTHAEIFPHAYCNTSSMVSWDGSDVTVTGRCVGNNQVRFVLTNTGTSPMTVAQSYWIVEDNIMVRGGTFQLAASGSDSVTITADPHKIYRIIAAETAGNPAHNTQETFLVWGCNGATNTIHWGFVNQYALNLGSAFEHQLCTQVRTSFDPNEISAVPEGVQNEHFIPKDTEIEYTIRFQNTGNDTAFVVRLLNTLPDALDKTTLKIGASSHPMTYSLKGNGVLEFLYTNILLPDSTTNEAKSHGFVRYKIRTKSNVVAGQTIDNQANIYFDVNAPVATNTYRHTIAADVASVFFSLSEVVTNRNYTVRVVPNPMRDAALLEIIANEDIQHSVKIFTLYNVFGQAITTQTFNDNTLLLQRENMPSGCYIYTINIDNEQISKGKIVVE